MRFSKAILFGLSALGILIGGAASATPRPAAVSGGGWGPLCIGRECHAFFMSEVIGRSGEPLSVRGNANSNNNGQPDHDALWYLNLEEWRGYISGFVPELADLVYKVSAEDAEALAASLESPGNTAVSPLLGPAIAQVSRNRMIPSLRYLALAKRVEPLATRNEGSYWEIRARPQPSPEEVSRELKAAKDLMDVAESRISVVDPFIAERYHFQVMRLLYYTNQFQEAQSYFERHSEGFTLDSSPKYRAMSLAAGAYYKEGQYGKADYLFSQIFDRFPAMAEAAYRSFHPMEDADWRETLALAKNDHEREVLWQLLGIYADPSAAIENIYAMNPRSKALPQLLMREVRQAEERWNSNEKPRENTGAENSAPKSDREILAKPIERVQRIADTGAVDKLYLWQLAAGYLFALSGDAGAAERYVRQAVASLAKDPGAPESEAILMQARMTILLARVRVIDAIDKQAEPFLAEELRWLAAVTRNDAQPWMDRTKQENLYDWIRGHLSAVYSKGNDPADRIRALMLLDAPRGDPYKNLSGIDPILEFMGRAQTAFDRFLAGQSMYGHSAESLQEVRGIHLLYSGDFAVAVDAFAQAGEEGAIRQLRADPFTIHIRDCRNCDREALASRVSGPSYTKKNFAEAMLSLSKASAGPGEDAARAHFALANGFYNMSFYGNGRRDIYASPGFYFSPHSYDWPVSIWEFDYWAADGNDRNAGKNESRAPSESFNMDQAEQHYLEAARLSSDRELKAQATFMAAKAEQNRRYFRKQPGNYQAPGAYFQTLRDSYSDTAYYQEIIRECGYFRKYVER